MPDTAEAMARMVGAYDAYEISARRTRIAYRISMCVLAVLFLVVVPTVLALEYA